MEIKYRVWDGIQIIYQNHINWIDFKNNIISVFDEYAYDDSFSKYIDIKNNLNQYTNCKDINNIEIYEEDIIKTTDNKIGVVKHGKYDTTNPEGKCNIGFYIEWTGENYSRVDLGYWINKIEVIGNNYQNKELIRY